MAWLRSKNTSESMPPAELAANAAKQAMVAPAQPPATDAVQPAGVDAAKPPTAAAPKPTTEATEEWQAKLVPEADPRIVALKRELHQQVISGLDLTAVARWNPEQLRMEVRRQAEIICRARKDLLSAVERERLVSEVLDEAFGLGPLEPLMTDPDVSDILINGPKVIYVERQGRLVRTPITFHDDRHLIQIVQRIAAQVGRRVDETSPMVDARLADGSRLNAVIAPLALDGALVSIRRFGNNPLRVRSA